MAVTEDRSGVWARGQRLQVGGWSRCLHARALRMSEGTPRSRIPLIFWIYLIYEFREYHQRQEPNTWGFNFLIFVSHEYHQRFSSFSCQNFGEYHKKFPNNSMKSSSQNKKNMRGFYWNHALVIFWQKYCVAFTSSYLNLFLLGW